MKVFLVIVGLFALAGCIRDDEVITAKERLEMDVVAIDNHLAVNNIQAQAHPSGLRYVVHEAGSGKTPAVTDVINIDYEGRLLTSGTVFDSGNGEWPLNQLIQGWQIGLPLIQEGGEITLYIPSGLAYGEFSPSPAIPPHSNLIFDVTLNDVR